MNRYMSLVNRLMWIMDHFGVSWKPIYEEEAKRIRKELKAMKELVEEETKKTRRERWC